jgi:hypothetical protein
MQAALWSELQAALDTAPEKGGALVCAAIAAAAEHLVRTLQQKDDDEPRPQTPKAPATKAQP